MAKELSNTWIIIRIGKRKYAINSSYVKAITDVSKSQFITESSGAFVRGVYKVLDIDIPILDGHKIAREEQNDKSKINFAAEMTQLKINYIKWLDSVEWAVMYGNAESADIETSKYIQHWINEYSISGNDKYLEKQIARLKQYLSVSMPMCEDIVKRRKAHKLGITDALNELQSVRSDAKKFIEMGIDSIIEYHNETVSEFCIIVSANSRDFGITIDSIELIHDATEKANTNEQRTVLSTGTIEVNKNKYNVLGLTKLANLIV